jgi:hypothetical protein
MRWIFLCTFLGFYTPSFAQKMLLVEHVHRVRPDKFYVGQQFTFQLDGDAYWYTRTLQDILPESNSILVDGYLVNIDDITAIKVHRRRIWKVIGGALVSLGISLGASAIGAAIYEDWDQNYPLIIGGGAASFGIGVWLLKRRTLYLKKKHRLRVIEIKFDPPPPPKA